MESLWQQLGIDFYVDNIITTFNSTAAARAKMPQVGLLHQVNGISLSKIKDNETLSAQLLRASRFTFSVAENPKAKPRRYVLSAQLKFTVPMPKLNASLPVLSSGLASFLNGAQPYSPSTDTPIEIPSGGNIVVDEDLLMVEFPPTGKYPYGATAYTKAYKGTLPDVPATRRKILSDGTIVIRNEPSQKRP